MTENKSRAVLIAILILVVGIAAGFFFGRQLAGETPAPEMDTQSAGPETSETGLDIAAPKITHRAEFSFPYPVSWTGDYKEAIALSGVAAYSSGEGSRVLELFFKIDTASDVGSSFCSRWLKESILRRLINEEGDLQSPESSSDECIVANSSLVDQRASFAVPTGEEEITILVFSETREQIMFFTIQLFDNGTLKVEPAPTRG